MGALQQAWSFTMLSQKGGHVVSPQKTHIWCLLGEQHECSISMNISHYDNMSNVPNLHENEHLFFLSEAEICIRTSHNL